jgi:hypothetical protein
MFVDVSPSVAAPEPPKQTPYYSDKNSVAANPDADKDSDVPKITGQQKEVVRTEDVPRTKAFPLQPTPAPATPAREEQPEEKPKPPPAPGDLALAKPIPPQPEPPKDQGEAPHKRPATIKEALARNNLLAGQKMDQEGGVKRRNLESSLDVRGSPFGAYDAKIIAAVQNRWLDLLDNRNFLRDRTGKVTVRFHLNPMEHRADFLRTQWTALGLLCQAPSRTRHHSRPGRGHTAAIGADAASHLHFTTTNEPQWNLSFTLCHSHLCGRADLHHQTRARVTPKSRRAAGDRTAVASHQNAGGRLWRRVCEQHDSPMARLHCSAARSFAGPRARP